MPYGCVWNALRAHKSQDLRCYQNGRVGRWNPSGNQSLSARSAFFKTEAGADSEAVQADTCWRRRTLLSRGPFLDHAGNSAYFDHQRRHVDKYVVDAEHERLGESHLLSIERDRVDADLGMRRPGYSRERDIGIRWRHPTEHAPNGSAVRRQLTNLCSQVLNVVPQPIYVRRIPEEQLHRGLPTEAHTLSAAAHLRATRFGGQPSPEI